MISGMDKPNEVFEHLCAAAQEGGVVAKAHHGNVANDMKETEMVSATESERSRAMRTAKTVIDEMVQEIILKALSGVLDPSVAMVDAEETTPSLAIFPATDAPISLVVDPIDGTLEYIEGKDQYSIAVGIISEAHVQMALVFYPAWDRAYALAPDGKTYVYEHFSTKGKEGAAPLEIASPENRIIYKRRMPKELSDKFTAAGFEVIGEEQDLLCLSYAEAILTVIKGRAAGFGVESSQMRDIFMGAILGSTPDGFMCDWSGNELQWLKKGRLPTSFFGNAVYKNEILSLLK